MTTAEASDQRPVLAIDIDDCLVVWDEVSGRPVVNEALRNLIRAWKILGLGRLIAWSGGGDWYAARVVREIGLAEFFDQTAAKGTVHADMTIDDQQTNIGTVNLRLASGGTPHPWLALPLIEEPAELSGENINELLNLGEKPGSSEEVVAADDSA